MLFFVIGTGRCGSTVVAELFARHPDVGFVSNVDDKLARLDLSGRWNSALFRRAALRLRQFLAAHCSKLRSTNPLERVNREIGRRTDVVCDTSLRDPTTPLLA